ncbi:MAG: 2-dehydropantoate 2-reductase [Anaerolineae bacterium]|nr:2-dehydropantoate 2-reductase [Anaerolineae bacterium]
MGTRIAVLGVGGIGGSIVAYLARSGQDVTAIDQWAEHVEVMRREGLTLSDVNETFTVPVRALHLSDVSGVREPFDMVFLSVKSYDTVWLTHLIGPHVATSGCVLPAMNALNDETVARIVGYPRTVGCVTTISAGVYEPGHVVRTDPTTTHAFSVGELHGLVTPRVRTAVQMLTAIGPSEATTNIWGARWAKLIWNSMGNALAGLLGPHATDLTSKQRDLADAIRIIIGREAAKVALAQGVVLEPVQGIPGERFAHAEGQAAVQALQTELARAAGQRQLTPEQLARLPQPGRPSLLQDVIKGRRTEVDYLNGEVVRRGAELGVATPMNQAMIAEMHRLEAGEIEPGAEHLAALEPYLGF